MWTFPQEYHVSLVLIKVILQLFLNNILLGVTSIQIVVLISDDDDNDDADNDDDTANDEDDDEANDKDGEDEDDEVNDDEGDDDEDDGSSASLIAPDPLILLGKKADNKHTN